METDKEKEELAEEIRERQRRARVAKRILADQEYMQVLDEMKAEHHIAFERMTYGAKLEDYQTIHFSLMAVNRLINKLDEYIVINEYAEKDGKIDELMSEAQI